MAMELSRPTGQIQDMQGIQQLVKGQQELERNPLIMQGLEQRMRNDDLTTAADIGYRASGDADPTQLFNMLLERLGLGGQLQERPQQNFGMNLGPSPEELQQQEAAKAMLQQIQQSLAQP